MARSDRNNSLSPVDFPGHPERRARRRISRYDPHPPPPGPGAGIPRRGEVVALLALALALGIPSLVAGQDQDRDGRLLKARGILATKATARCHYFFFLPQSPQSRKEDEVRMCDARRLPEMAGDRMASAPKAGSSARKRARG
jgi:hypothetical protein